MADLAIATVKLRQDGTRRARSALPLMLPLEIVQPVDENATDLGRNASR